MSDLASALDDAINGTERLRRSLTKGRTRQVQSTEEKAQVKATALAWFNAQRPLLSALGGDAILGSIDRQFQDLLECSGRSTSRSRYRDDLKTLKESLLKFRSDVIVLVNSGQIPKGSTEKPPDFARLIPDPRMTTILQRRWEETRLCRSSGAHLAATVMMGALLEALLLARVNREPDKSKVFSARTASRDSKSGKPLPLTQWTLKNYLDVAHELGWIRRSAKDVGEVLRDYRNYIHPEKEYKHGVALDQKDTGMFWLIFLSLSEQIIDSA